MTSNTLPFEDEFNEFGLVINRDAETGTIYFRGTNDVGGTINDDTMSADIIVNREEFWWLSICWRKATGRELKLPTREMIRAEIAKGTKDPKDRRWKERIFAKMGMYLGVLSRPPHT